MYLLGETSSQIGLEMDERARAELVEEYFSSSGVGAPEVEGFLWLKAESKKSWKKFRFVLRTSGLYYAPKAASATASAASKLASKPSHSTKDLVCLARFDVNQVANSTRLSFVCASNSSAILTYMRVSNDKYLP